MTKHALIIEDEQIIAMHIKDMLREEGYDSFAYASTDRLALEAANLKRPCLITADLALLDGAGTAAIDRIYHDHGRIPTLFITGTPESVRPRSQQRVIGKPILRSELSAALQALG